MSVTRKVTNSAPNATSDQRQSRIEPLEYAVPLGAEVLARLIRRDGFTAAEHAHAEAQVSFFRRGSSAMFLTRSIVGHQNRTAVAPGSITFITHHQPHRTHWKGDGEMVNIYFPEALLGELAGTDRPPTSSRCHIDKSP